jgi:iron(III) transport system ATP-binding protein
VLIRPEQMTLAPFPRSVEGVTGKVTEARYHGHDALIAADVTDVGALQMGLAATGLVMVWPEGSF